MDILFIKITLTPLLMLAVSMASRRWGGTVGGVLAGLPLTAGPVAVYLTLEQGRAFAASTAVGAMGGLVAVTFSYLAYLEVSRRLSIPATVVATLLAFLTIAGGLRLLDLPLGPLLAFNGLAIAIVLLRGPQPTGPGPRIAYAAWDLPARVLISTSMVLVITLSAAVIGPRYSGLLSTVPMIGWPLIVFAHKQQGRAEALTVLLGIVRGCPGLLAFYLAIYLLFPQNSPLFTFSAALVLALSLTGAMVLQRRLMPGLMTR